MREAANSSATQKNGASKQRDELASEGFAGERESGIQIRRNRGRVPGCRAAGFRTMRSDRCRRRCASWRRSSSSSADTRRRRRCRRLRCCGGGSLFARRLPARGFRRASVRWRTMRRRRAMVALGRRWETADRARRAETNPHVQGLRIRIRKRFGGRRFVEKLVHSAVSLPSCLIRTAYRTVALRPRRL